MKDNNLVTYRKMIDYGDVIVGDYLRREVYNLCEDLENEDLYIYNTHEAETRFKFQESLCLQSKAPYYMQPVKLMPWQKAFWETLYSFKMRSTGRRRFTEALLLIARKNGKSTMFAADANTDLFIGAGGMDICCASNDDRQAKLIWKEVAGMRSRLDGHRVLTSQNLIEIRNNVKNITVFRLSSKTQNKDGFNIDKAYIDESHDMENDEITEAIWRAMSVKEEPLFLNCTTNGFVNNGYLDKKLDIAHDIIDGTFNNIHFLPWLYEQDNEAEIWQDPATWEKSNPAIRYGVKKTAKLEQDMETAKRDKGARVHLLCKDFNIKQNTAESWLNYEDYNYNTGELSFEDFRNCIGLAAVDLAETTDLTNCKIMFIRPDDKTKYVFSHYWIPESKLAASDDKASGAQYKEWARAGYMTISEGNDNQLTDVADWIFSLKKLYGIRIYACGYDQRFAKDFLNRMEEYGIQTENIPQRPAVMSSPMKWVEADFRSQLINYGENPVDKWCLGNASVQVNNLGQQLAVKINNLPSRRIDGAVTLIILYATLQRFRSEYNKYIE